jgi:DNA-binding transcriptional regulator YiaG
MTITTNHPSSSYGLPVILDDDGQVMDYAAGVEELRARLGLSRQALADACGVSRRTVEGWEQGRLPGAAALNVMGELAEQ